MSRAMKFAVISVLIIILCITPLMAQEKKLADHPRVKEALTLLKIWTQAQLDYDRIPGISMAVVHDQETVWSGGFGFSDVENAVPATADTIYSICSISKLFTSIGVMQLRDAGKLSLEDPISKHLSWFQIKDSYPDDPQVNVKSLLTHSSGLPRESDYPYWNGPDFTFPERDMMLKRLPEQTTLYPLNTYFQYSNLGLTLAGEIVAAASGQEYGDYIKEHILGPLALSNTAPNLRPDLVGGQMATGYGKWNRSGDRETVRIFDANAITPAAGFSSTANDLAKFAAWQFKLLGHGSDDVLNAYTLKDMQRVQWLDSDFGASWGLGFSIWRDGDTVFLGHGGSCPGFRTQLQLHTRDKIGTIFMANAMDVNTRMYTLQAYNIMAPALKAAMKSEEKETKKEAEAEDFSKFTGLYESAWGEAAVIIWEGKLVIVYLPTTRPLDAMEKLKHIEGNTFRRIRKHDELGEEVVFEVDESGNVTRYWQHSTYMKKVK